jgi:hypothetical protein
MFNNLKTNIKMDEIRKLADKIILDYHITMEDKTNRLLQLDAIQYTNLGMESTKGERMGVKANSKYIYKKIRDINPDVGKQLIGNMDV